MKNIIGIICVLSGLSLAAQTELPTGQIEVIKGFEVRLTETTKIKIVPQPVPVDSNVRRYEYRLLAPSPSIQYLTPEIKPLAIQPERKNVYYPFYAKAGYGSPNSFLGMVSYDHSQSEQLSWGVDFRQLSANNKKIPLQKFSDTQGRVDGTYLLTDNVRIDGYIDGQIEKVYFYGAEVIPPNEDALKRVFNRFDARFDLAQPYAPETSLRYRAFLQYLSDKDDLGSKETGFSLGGEVGTDIGNDEYPIGLKIRLDNSTLKHSEDYSLNNFLLEPFFDYTLGDIKMHLGGIALFHKNQNEILPDLAFSYFIFNSRMTLVAGWKGKVDRNNFHFLSAYNPYISTRLDSLNNMLSREIYAGVKGASGSLGYELKGSYTTFDGMAFFLQDIDAEEEFDPVYDDGHYIGIEGTLRMELLKHMDLRAQVFQRFYTLDHEDKPWERPSFGLNSQVTYTGGEDVYHVSLLFNMENGLPYRTVGGTEDALSPLLDLNLHADYFFTPSFGAFTELNNVLGNKRERWVSYPSYGFNIKAGIICRLP